mmetsp:Transcript_54287/g.137126  ORF Transcript_54287/g.137126 Transcript_54287/m.137126 type:complete len:267 (+) Transcript_54287:215-1015(+)
MGLPSSFLNLTIPGYGTALCRRSMNSILLPAFDMKKSQKAFAPASWISFCATAMRVRRPLLFFRPSTKAKAPSVPIELPLMSRKRKALLTANICAKFLAAAASNLLYCKLICPSVGWDFSGPSQRWATPLLPRRHAARHSDFTDLFLARPAQNSPSTPSASQMLLLKMTFSSDVLAPMTPPMAFMPAVPKRARGMSKTLRFFPTLSPVEVVLVRPCRSHCAPSSPMLLSERFNSSKGETLSFSWSFSKTERTAWAPYLEAHWCSDA